ncbi:MAG: glutaredoxin family protein [Cyanobacteria bacterium P01_H01_bin.15]
MQLVLYSKPGCHLCEGLEEKLTQIDQPAFDLEIRNITTRPDWFQAYQYEIPVLCQVIVQGDGVIEKALPRFSPRASVAQVARLLQKYTV